MEMLPPYTITIPRYKYENSALQVHIQFQKNVYANSFFKFCYNLQDILEKGIVREPGKTDFEQLDLHKSQIILDFSRTEWFDTLALCYLALFSDYATRQYSLSVQNENAIQFYFPEHPNAELFMSFLIDNGFYDLFSQIGIIHPDNIQRKVISYSTVHKCVLPFKLLHHNNDIAAELPEILSLLRAELVDELSAYELEYIINKAKYFLQETLENAYKHGYREQTTCTPSALLIRRVKISDAVNLYDYSAAYVPNTPYIIKNLLEEKQDYLEIYVADIGIGLRRSFLNSPDDVDKEITDENILDFILSNGERSRKKASSQNSTKYGGLYDISSLFREDSDIIAFKGDSRWFVAGGGNNPPTRINPTIPQHQYDGLPHGFAIIGNISWKKRHFKNYPLKKELSKQVEDKTNLLYGCQNPWMNNKYKKNVFIADHRFTVTRKNNPGGKAQVAVVFPQKHSSKPEIIDLLLDSYFACYYRSLIISGIHEGEYNKFKSTIETLEIDSVCPNTRRIVLITDTLFPYIFSRKKGSKSFILDLEKTKDYVDNWTENPNSGIEDSYISFRLWKKVYDSEMLWQTLSEQAPHGYINSLIKWGNLELRGYLDFSQLYCINECRMLCLEQLYGFSVPFEKYYFSSLDRIVDELCEQANSILDNTKEGKCIWIGSVFVSGTSERILESAEKRNQAYYFFQHIDSKIPRNQVNTLLEWASKQTSVDRWFTPADKSVQYSRIGNTSFVAPGGNSYWLDRHTRNWNCSQWLKPGEIYRILQRQYGAHPSLLKVCHFISDDHHDLFEIKLNSLVETDISSCGIISDAHNNSLTFLIVKLLAAIANSPSIDSLESYLNPQLPALKKEIICREYRQNLSASKTDPCHGMNSGHGLVVFLNDYHTTQMIEKIKPLFSEKLQKRFYSLTPIDKDYASTTLLLSPIQLNMLENSIANFKKEVNSSKINIVIFIPTSFTTRLQEELKHIMLCMGAEKVIILSIFDRQRLPFGNEPYTTDISYTRLSLPAAGLTNSCRICKAIDTIKSLLDSLRDSLLLERVNFILSKWASVSESENHFYQGIGITPISLPPAIDKEIREISRQWKNENNISIDTDLGLCLFSIEHTTITLSIDFLYTCINDPDLDSGTKLLLLSAHLLLFDARQLSEKHQCNLTDLLCDTLAGESNTSIYTSIAVIALCGQDTIFCDYIQNHFSNQTKKGFLASNNDCLIAQLAIFQSLQMQNSSGQVEYYREMACYFVKYDSILQTIYDLFLYSEIEYRQSHRQAFAHILSSSSIIPNPRVYSQAAEYAEKIREIFCKDKLKEAYYHLDLYDQNRNTIVSLSTELIEMLKNVDSTIKHQELKSKLKEWLELIQSTNEGLYLRAVSCSSAAVEEWLHYCEAAAKQRFGKNEDVIKTVISKFPTNYIPHGDVYPWFYVHKNVTEEVINLYVDMIKRRSHKLRDFLQVGSDKDCKAYDGIIEVVFKKDYVEVTFYNATTNPMDIKEIRYIKQSKENRPSFLTFHQFETILSRRQHGKTFQCFQWNYSPRKHYLANNKTPDEGTRLFQAIIRIPYVDLGSSFFY